MRETVLKRALALLTTLKASYIIEVDGNRYSEGSLEKELTQQRLKRDGLLSLHIGKYIDHLKPGESAVIPVAEFGHDRVQSTAGSRAGARWGNNSYITERMARDEHGNYTEIHFMRLATVQVEEE